MKVIGTDNFARDSVADILVETGLDKEDAEHLASELNDGDGHAYWYLAVDDDYKLWRGMAGLV